MENSIHYAKAAAYIASAIAIAFGTLGPALAQGMIGSKACESVGKNPESANSVRIFMILALAAVETCAIYAVLISGAILMYAP